jgi:fructose-bisphosphate aldolase class II
MAEQDWFTRHGLRYFAALGKEAASQSRVPVALILNEVLTFEHIKEGIKAGFNVVMMDTSRFPFKKNLDITKKIVKIAHPKGVSVEAELGELPMAKNGAFDIDSYNKTDPEEAAIFAEETGVDALSVSIGNVHVLTKGKARIDFERLKDIRERVDIPLVIHGGTGFPADAVRKVIKLGVCKFNVGTILKKIYLEETKKYVSKINELNQIQQLVGSRGKKDIFHKATLEMKGKVKYFMRLYGSWGKA